MLKKLALSVSIAASIIGFSAVSHADEFKVLTQIENKPTLLKKGEYSGNYYVPSTLNTITWGYLPNKDAKPVITIPSGSTVTFDTVSHEGLLEDQGRDAEKYFKSKGVKADQILDEAKLITGSKLAHDFHKDGPHIVTGPVFVEGAMPGDILKVEILKVEPRVPYGVISNRHGKGTLSEFPKREKHAHASPANPEAYGNVSIFTPIEKNADGAWEGVLKTESGKSIRFPLNPFMGTMGVAPNTSDAIHSVPPSYYGGNIDINDLTAGATAYYPVQVPGALFYTGDSHFVQGDGEVALTALEASARATFKITVLKSGKDKIPGKTLSQPLGENAEFWITPGLDEDLDEAMRKSTREAIRFLVNEYGVTEEVAYAYLSAATDFEVSQVVDKTKGIHAMIRKADFKEFVDAKK